MTGSRIAFLVGALLGLATFPARAEDTREACRTDAILLCPDAVSARDRKAVRACIRSHIDDVSERCRTAIRDQNAKPAEVEDRK